jgi:hypothetical protein
MLSSPLIFLVLFGGTGSGVRTSGGGGPECHWIANGVERAADTANAQFSKRMRFGGAVTSLDWTQVTPGVDGPVDGGASSFTVSLVVDGVTKCSLVVDCDASRGDYTTTCTRADFATGQDLDVKVTATNCLTTVDQLDVRPVGFPGLDGTSR